MNLAGDDKYYPSLSCADEGYTCSSPITLELSESNIVLEDFGDGRRDNCESCHRDIRVHTDFENCRRDKLPLAETNSEDETSREKELKINEYPEEKGEFDADLEEGEIQDTPNSKSGEAYSCRYYQKGLCGYGKDCRFLHLSDKGLYNMFDFPSADTKSVHCQNQLVLDHKCVCVPPAVDDLESDWDRALKEAKKLIKESKMKVSVGREKRSMTIQSGEHVDDRPPAKESPLNNKRCQSVVIKVCDSSRGEMVSSYAVMDARLKLNQKSKERDSLRGSTYRCSTPNFKRSKTPNHMRWSPISASCSSRSRSRNHSFCKQASCSSSVTSNPKRSRRAKSSRVSKNYRKQCTSSSSESSLSNYVPKKAPRRISSRSRGSRSHLKKPITSNYRSTFKILLPRELEGTCSRSSRRDIPRRLIPSKYPVTSKLVPLKYRSNSRSCSDSSVSDSFNRNDGHQSACSRSFRRDIPHRLTPSKHAVTSKSAHLEFRSDDRSCSDMSISPLSDSLNRKDGHSGGRPVASYSSNSDMSISPFSDDSSFERFSGQTERIVPKSSVKNINVDTVQKRSRKGVVSTKSCTLGNTIGEKYMFARSTASIPASRTQTEKSNSLLRDLMKFQGYYKGDDSFKKPKNVQSKTPASTDVSKLAVGLIECSALGKINQNADVNQRDSSLQPSDRVEAIMQKSSVKNMSVDIVQKRSVQHVESTKSCPLENTSREISLSASSTAPIPAARMQITKSNSLLKDLMKFHGCVKKGDSYKKPKNMQSKTPASMGASKLAVGVTKCNAVEKIKNTNVNQSKLSRKEILLIRLEEVNAAIERKKIHAPCQKT